MKRIGFILIMVPVVVFAYKEPTHEDMTESAMKFSILADTSQNLMLDLGLKNDLTDDKIQKFSGHDNTNRSVKELMRFGARYEDDEETGRSLNHFFDPVNDRALTVLGSERGAKSPDWALEDNADNDSQHYSYKDSMDFFYKAMTARLEADRKKNFGLMFQSLGHVVHHLQDMAQPEHVRNDAHCDKWYCGIIGQFDPSYYETYTNDHKSETHISGLISGKSYPIPKFDTARKFWTTDASVPARRGMADFTNRNFVSNNTNFKRGANGEFLVSDYALPIPDPVPIPRNIADVDLKGAEGQRVCDRLKQTPPLTFPAFDCVIEFVSNEVTDSYTGQSSNNARASTYSLFNKNLSDYDKDAIVRGSYVRSIFTLNEFNYDAAHNYLIPRAVPYSAGLINHFFKTKLELTKTSGSGDWSVKNLSDVPLEGTFELYSKSITNGTVQKIGSVNNVGQPLARDPDLGISGAGPIPGAYLYQLKLATCPWKLPGETAFKLHEQFHGP